MTYDRRTGKPIASAVTKISPEVVSILSNNNYVQMSCMVYWLIEEVISHVSGIPIKFPKT